MSGYLLQLNFRLTVPVAEYQHAAEHVAHSIASVDGLRSHAEPSIASA